MIQVTAAIIHCNGRYLLAQRPVGAKLPLKWEFPGGKIESGESLEECLARELLEEFGVQSSVKSLICQEQYKYDHISVEVSFFEVVFPVENLKLNYHSAIAWVEPTEFLEYDLVEADKAVIKYLQTPHTFNS